MLTESRTVLEIEYGRRVLVWASSGRSDLAKTQTCYQNDAIQVDPIWLNQESRQKIVIEEVRSAIVSELADSGRLLALKPQELANTTVTHHPQRRKMMCKDCQILCSILLTPKRLDHASNAHPSLV